MKKNIPAFIFMLVAANWAIAQTSEQSLRRIRTRIYDADFTGQAAALSEARAQLEALKQREGPTQVLAFYYAGFASWRLSLPANPDGLPQLKHVQDAINDLKRAIELKPDFADACALLATVYEERVGLDPRGLGPTLGPVTSAMRRKSVELAPKNPRVVLLDSMTVFWTPEAYGGGREAGVKRALEAIGFFQNERLTDPLMPDWGLPHAWVFAGQAYLGLAKPDPTQARAAFAKALSIRPDFQLAKSLQRRVPAP